METTVFLMLDVNFQVMDDIQIVGTFSSLESAFAHAYADITSKNGKNLKVHNYQIEGEETTIHRLSNNNSLGSQYGISYKSYYGDYRCCRMIIPQRVKGE